jgi:hypothetical protein
MIVEVMVSVFGKNQIPFVLSGFSELLVFEYLTNSDLWFAS